MIHQIPQAPTGNPQEQISNQLMKNNYATTIVEIISLAIAGGVLGTISGHFMESFLIVLATFLGITLWHRNRFYNWLSNEQSPEPPETSDLWADIFKRIILERSATAQKTESISRELADLKNVVSNLPLGVVITDTNWTLITINHMAEQLLDLSQSNDRGASLFSLIRSPSLKQYAESQDYQEPIVIDNIQDTGVSIEFCFTRDIGNTRIILIRDVTKFKKTNEMRSDFIANVSHELKTPLTVVNGYLETLIDHQLVTGATLKAIENAAAQGRRMENIIQDLLTLSQLETSTIEEGQSFGLNKIVDDAIAQARLLAISLDKNNTKIIAQIEYPIELHGNPDEIFSLVSNILSNAIRYTADNSSVLVTAHLKNQTVTLRIEDDGPGIAERHLHRLTERFYRVDESHSSSTGGTGLGLSIANHIMSRHNGELRIDSKHGKGTVVECYFPKSSR